MLRDSQRLSKPFKMLFIIYGGKGTTHIGGEGRGGEGRKGGVEGKEVSGEEDSGAFGGGWEGEANIWHVRVWTS